MVATGFKGHPLNGVSPATEFAAIPDEDPDEKGEV